MGIALSSRDGGSDGLVIIVALQETIPVPVLILISDDLFQQDRIFDAIDDDDLVRLVECIVVGPDAIGPQEVVVILEGDGDRRAGDVDIAVVLTGKVARIGEVRWPDIALIVEAAAGNCRGRILSP